MYLFFDTETTGLPTNYSAPVHDLDNWPRMVQIAWLKYDKDQNLISSANHIIRPEGFIIPTSASDIHGITTDKAIKQGVLISSALTEFSKTISDASILIAHNMDFDANIVGAELLRAGIQSNIMDKRKYCTMKSSTKLCKIPGKFGIKWPTLAELHFFLFNEGFVDAHDALIDVQICAKCFLELRRIGFIQDNQLED